MKCPLLLFLMLYCFSIQANVKDGQTQIVLGGVDVGNGMVTNSGFELVQDFDSEEELVAHFNQLSKQILSGEHKTVKDLIRLGSCAKGMSKLQNLHWRNHYRASEGKFLKKKYKGIINIGLYKCRRPEVVKVSEKLLPPLLR